MFNSLLGTITEKRFDILRVDNNGLEWEFSVPARSIDEFGTLGGRTKVYIHLLHREDQMRLFGFPSERERALFLELLKVEGIGPRQAVKILSGISPEDLESALDTENLARLQQVPGLGAKTAQKLVFSLKGKLPGSAPQTVRGPWADVVQALADMGYDRKRAAEAVARLSGELGAAGGPEAEQELFRRAIRELSA
ncbi:MAG TPA: Holliday junction branch migration protein RuvA [Spirochaetia bacterium]|nr:Holliday junction branch migration protein RuvA [Spirochaetales bacterium]HRY80447.1 Holliday junction branch migration protein RuvA [Spirochaetia bacterium]HRZ90862.1 Holliday junction branch migration protein RuvA [Spirochaetia bacterium]